MFTKCHATLVVSAAGSRGNRSVDVVVVIVVVYAVLARKRVVGILVHPTEGVGWRSLENKTQRDRHGRLIRKERKKSGQVPWERPSRWVAANRTPVVNGRTTGGTRPSWTAAAQPGKKERKKKKGFE